MEVPVLMYHEINNKENFKELSKYINEKYIVDESLFEKQLNYLYSRRYICVTIAELIKQRTNITTVAITFDDGYRGNYLYAFQMLKKFAFKATFFITSDWVGLPGFLTWEQIKEMSDCGMEIGSHTCSHALLETLSPGRVKEELENSKMIIEQNIQKAVKSISYPNGSFNDLVNKIAPESGYEAACISEFKYWDSNNGSFNIPRIAAKNDLNSFAKILAKDNLFLLREGAKEKIKTIIRKSTGRKLYNTLYMKIFNLNEIGSKK